MSEQAGTKANEQPQELPDDATVDLRAEFKASQIQEVLDKELIGLKPIKTRIREIAALLLVERMHKKMALSAETPTLHMSFTGNPGTGKAAVALRMAQILHKLEYVREGHLIAVTRDDRVGQYIGHTAPRPKRSSKRPWAGCCSSMKRITYTNPRTNATTARRPSRFCYSSWRTIVTTWWSFLPRIKRKWRNSFKATRGMRSRIAHHPDFSDYCAEELLAIAKLMLEDQNYRFSEEREKTFAEYIRRRMQQPHFANARSIRNALDRSRLRQANRLFAKGVKLT